MQKCTKKNQNMQEKIQNMQNISGIGVLLLLIIYKCY